MGCGCSAAGKVVAEYHNPDCSYVLGSGMSINYSISSLESIAGSYTGGGNC